LFAALRGEPSAPDLAELVGSPELKTSLNLELPIGLPNSIPGLALPADAAVSVTWDDMQSGSQPRINTRGLSSLQAFSDVSGIGLSDDLRLLRVLGEPLDIRSNPVETEEDEEPVEIILPELRIVLADSTEIDIDFDSVEPGVLGSSRRAVSTFGDLRAAISGQSNGLLSLAYSANGRSLVLRPTDPADGPISVSGIDGSLVVEQLGLDSLNAQGVGRSLMESNVLEALRHTAELLRQFEQSSPLTGAIPGTQTSLNDLLGFADQFEILLDRLQQRPIRSVQQLVTTLADSLGLPADRVQVGYQGNALKVVVDWSYGSLQDIKLNLDLGEQLGWLVDARGAAGAEAAAAGMFTLAMGIDLVDPQQPRPFLYTNSLGEALLQRGTSLDVLARVWNENPINFSSVAGPLRVHLSDGWIALNADGTPENSNPAMLAGRLVPDSPEGGRTYLDLGSLPVLQTIFDGAAGLSLPISYPTPQDVVGNIVLEAPDLLQPTNFSLTVPDFSAAIAAFDPVNQVDVIRTGWDTLFGLLEDRFTEEFAKFDLPVVGSNMRHLTKFLEELRDIDISGDNAQTFRAGLFAGIQGIGSGYLADRNGDSVVTIDDVGMTVSDDHVQFDLLLAGSFQIDPQQTTLPFDLALPGLGLNVLGDPTISLEGTFEFQLGIGVDRQQGVYLALDPASSEDLSVTFAANLIDPGVVREATLGFLKYDVETRRTEAAAELVFDFQVGPTGRMPIGSILGAPIAPTITGLLTSDSNAPHQAVILDWQMTTNLGSEAVLPKLRSDLDIGWSLNGSSNLGSGLQVGFESVQFELTSFLLDFVHPVLEGIDAELIPFNQVVDALAVPMKEVFNAINLPSSIGEKSLLDFLSDSRFGIGGADYSNYREARNHLRALRNSLAALKSDESFVRQALGEIVPVWIDLGSFWLRPSEIRGRTFVDRLSFSSIVRSLDQIKSQVDQEDVNSYFLPVPWNPDPGLLLRPFTSAFERTFQEVGSSRLEFPIISQPANLFDMMLGVDKELFAFDLPQYRVGVELSVFFPVWGPLGIRLIGGVAVSSDSAFGFDTFGLRQFAESGFSQVNLISQGFYLRPLNQLGGVPAVRQLTTTIGIAASLELNPSWIQEIQVLAGGGFYLRAGVGGGILADITIDRMVSNRDGRIRPDDSGASLRRSGELYGRLFAYLEAGICDPIFLGCRVPIWDWRTSSDFSLLDFTIFELVASTNLSTVDANGTLLFTVGDRHDQFIVAPGDSPNQVIVRSGGREEVRDGVVSILFDKRGLSGDSRFVVLPGVTVPVVVYTGTGNDYVTTGDGPAEIYAQAGGNNTLQLGAGGGIVVGGEGNDQIWGSAGNDILIGGGGNNTIRGVGGNNLIIGTAATVSGLWSGNPFAPGVTIALEQKPGRNRIEGGDGSDLIYGGYGDDTIEGGGGNDWIRGVAGNNTLRGGYGNDIIIGGPGNNVIDGGQGNDVLIGDSATVHVAPSWNGEIHLVTVDSESGSGNDILFGGRGNDLIFTGRGNDLVDADSGDDRVFARGGTNTITLGTGNDFAQGGTGDDTIFGTSGNNVILGGTGGHNTLVAGSRVGDWGAVGFNNVLVGGPNSDRIYGGDGSDLIIGNIVPNLNWWQWSGNPEQPGLDLESLTLTGAGDNLIFGGGGSDLVLGGRGSDRIHLGRTVEGGGSLLDRNIAYGDFNRRPDGKGNFIYGSLGDDTIFGGVGSDTVVIVDGNNQVYLGPGNNRVTAGTGDNLISSRWEANSPSAPLHSGNNTIDVLDAPQPRDGSDPLDPMSVLQWHLQIETGTGDDTITAGSGFTKRIHSLGGNNRIHIGNGNSEIFLGSGDDTIFTGDGHHRILVSGGDNQVETGSGNDFIQTGAGNDTIRVRGGDNLIFAGDGNDRVWGSHGRDLIIGGGGDDTLRGVGNSNVIFGGMPPLAQLGWSTGEFTGFQDGQTAMFPLGQRSVRIQLANAFQSNG
jgi:Ca2+-binding RTX toxin-like protein